MWINEEINMNNLDMSPIISPKELKFQFPLGKNEKKNIDDYRRKIIDIIQRRDSRLLVVCGPCSIHDTKSAFDYGKKLKKLSLELQEQLYIVMRVYLEKPRTNVGWKGLINDPYMDNTCNIESGLKISRQLLLELTRIGLPLATEILHPNIPQYIGEFFSWAAIGARTTESQIHREVVSGLPMPVGFKNSIDGNLFSAINAIHASKVPHKYIGINEFGKVCILCTSGNNNTHVILRGGKKPNYYPKDITIFEKKIKESGLSNVLIIDCSHGNSGKNYFRQSDVIQSVSDQIICGNQSIVGLMLESYICSGNQSITFPLTTMNYGMSVTDECIDWETTEWLLRDLRKKLKLHLINRL